MRLLGHDAVCAARAACWRRPFPRAPCAACPAEAARQSEAATSESGFAGRPEWEEFAEHTRRGEFHSPQFKEGLEKLKLSPESLALMDQIMLSVKMRRARRVRA